MRERLYAGGLAVAVVLALAYGVRAADPVGTFYGFPRHTGGVDCTATSAGCWVTTGDDHLRCCAGTTQIDLSALLTTEGGLDSDHFAENSVGDAAFGATVMPVEFCGQLIQATPMPTPSGGAVYLGPGNFGAANNPGGTACDALDSETEATADRVIFVNDDVQVTGMFCTMGVGNALASGCTLALTLHDDTATTTPSVTCSIGSTQTDCNSTVDTTTNIAAGSALAIHGQMHGCTDGDVGDDVYCVVTFVDAVAP